MDLNNVLKGNFMISKVEELILEMSTNNTMQLKEELLELLSSLETVKSNQGLIFKNAWLDVFPTIIQTHKDYYHSYFQKNKVRETFKDYVLSEFLKMMHYLKSTQEDQLLSFSLWDKNQNNEGSKTYTRTLFAKQYYKAIKIADPDFALEIFQQTTDRYLVDEMDKEDTYLHAYDKLTTDYGKMILVTRIMENLKVVDTAIDIKPILKYKKDLLDIFEKCIEDHNQNLIYFVGEYLEYLTMFTSTKGVPDFKEEVIAILEKNKQDEMVQNFRGKTFL